MRCSYSLFTEMHGYVIDATLYGNAARFMNASCSPNLKPVKMVHSTSANLPRVLFYATRHIAAGEELTWRYHAQQQGGGARPPAGSAPGRSPAVRRSGAADTGVGYQAHRCFCGAPNCHGFL